MPRSKRFLAGNTNVQIVIVLAAIAALGAAANAHGGHTHTPVFKPTPEEISAFEVARPVFERHCFRCHTSTGKKSKPKALEHIAMDRYPFGGHHAGEAGKAIREVLGADGKSKPTMPSDDRGAVAGDELAKILAWADAFDRARASQPANTKGESAHAH
jgi:uncharacterized membrane protein